MKKGFTLVELLAVIVILGVISMITYTIITNNMKTTEKKSFEISAKNLLESTKQYVTKNMENNDFPEDGIDITSEHLGIKNNSFISGIVKRNEKGQIVLENVTDGNFCVTGTKNEMEITEGTCESIDDTAPELKIKQIKVGTTIAQIMIKTHDSGSGIESYELCYSDKCNTYEQEFKKTTIKDIIKLTDLKSNTEYKIKVTATNGANNKDIKTTTKEITIKTKEIEEPKFSISTNTYATNKELIISYPNNDNNYDYKYDIESQSKKETILLDKKDNEEKIKIDKSTSIRAYIEKDGQLIIESAIIIDDIDVIPPSLKVKIDDLETWTTSKTIEIESEDIGIGLALRPYTYDKGNNWTKDTQKTVSAAMVLNIQSRDRLGNISDDFILNDTKTCCVNCPNPCTLDSVDDEGPGIKFEIIEGTKENEDNEWYTSDKVVVKVTIRDEVKKVKSDGTYDLVEGGCGVDYDKIKITENGVKSDIKKINDNVYLFTMTKDGVYDISIEAEDKLGNKKKEASKLIIKKDMIQPTISAKSSITTEWYQLNSAVTNYFNVSAYGVAGGVTTCYLNNKKINNINELPLGINDIKCVMKANNGKSANASLTIKHKYNAKVNCSGGRSVSGANCTYHYSSNCGQCGDYCSSSSEVCDSCTKTRKKTCSGTKSESYACGETCTTKTCDLASKGYSCSYSSKTCKTKYCSRNVSYTYSCDESYTDSCCSTHTECNRRSCSSCTKTENGYRYYTCEVKGNDNTTGILNGSICNF